MTFIHEHIRFAAGKIEFAAVIASFPIYNDCKFLFMLSEFSYNLSTQYTHNVVSFITNSSFFVQGSMQRKEIIISSVYTVPVAPVSTPSLSSTLFHSYY